MLSQLKNKVRNLYIHSSNYDLELKKFIQTAEKFLKKSDAIADVGCGYGRLLSELKHKGYHNCHGVEINPDIVKYNCQIGLNCTLPAALEQNKKFDVLIMSHIIEHFSPDNLLSFMDFYLDRLKPNGKLFILTPLYTSYFYDDFDHVKPYHPTSIQMVFSNKNSQLKFQSKHKLELQDLWFRRSPYFPRMSRARYIRSPMRRVHQVLDLLSTCLFKISGGLIGQKDAWMGVFQKVS